MTKVKASGLSNTLGTNYWHSFAPIDHARGAQSGKDANPCCNSNMLAMHFSDFAALYFHRSTTMSLIAASLSSPTSTK